MRRRRPGKPKQKGMLLKMKWAADMVGLSRGGAGRSGCCGSLASKSADTKILKREIKA